MTMANMGGNAEYSYISWMDLRRTEQAAAEPQALRVLGHSAER